VLLISLLFLANTVRLNEAITRGGGYSIVGWVSAVV
jgi:hypothetical protein